MTSLGQADLIVDARTCGRIRVRTVGAEPGLLPRLRLDLEIELRNLKSRPQYPEPDLIGFELVNLIGELRIAEGGPTIGTLHWLNEHTHLRSSDNVIERPLRLVTQLDHLRLERIEQARREKPPSLWLQLWPTVLREGNQLNARINPFAIAVPRDSWHAVLADTQHSRLEIVEVQLPELDDYDFKQALDLIRQARNALDLGNYLEVSIRCRSALESGERVLKERGTDSAAGGEEWRRKYSRLLGSLKDAMSLEAHALGVAHTREEARFFLRTSISLLALFSRVAGEKNSSGPA